MLEERTEPLAPQSQDAKTWDAAVVGAGYVGVPLAHTLAKAGRSVLLIDVSPEVVDGINRGVSHIIDVPSEELAPLVRDGRVRATTDYNEIRRADAILIALPTPLSTQREPDLSIDISAAEQISTRLRIGHLVVLESTTYPGTTREVIQPILESTGLEAGRDFHLAFSPERVDPGNGTWTTKNVPKVVGGITPECTERAAQLYEGAVDTVHRVSSPEAAELTKLLENIFRSVNIALVNELAQLCDRMEIDVWEVDRGRRHEAVRLHELPAGARPRRTLHPDRSLLPDVEGARVRLLDRVHRARREGEREHALVLPVADLAGAQPRPRRSRSRAPRCSSSASPTRRTSTTRASRRRSS